MLPVAYFISNIIVRQMANVNAENDYQHLYHHLSQEAQSRLPNMMKVFFKSIYDIPNLTSLANGDPHYCLYPFSQIDYHIPALSTLGSVSSWMNMDSNAMTQKLSTYSEPGKSVIPLSVAMQYGTGLGLEILRQQLSAINDILHTPRPTTRGIVITLGNADSVTKTFRLLGSPGDTFLVEEYSFCGLTNSPLSQGVKWQPVKIDELGLIPEDMEKILVNWDESRGPRPHVLYCIPTGQNPTGATLSFERRQAIYALAQKYDIVIMEDDPYYFLHYNKDIAPLPRKPREEDVPELISDFVRNAVPSFLSLDTDGRVIRCDSFSKTFAPNMRIGWITCNTLFMNKLEILTDNSTQHPNGLGQSFMSEVLGEKGWGTNGYLLWVWSVRNEYERRRNFFMEVFQREVFSSGYATTTLPMSGMFFWVKINIERHNRFVSSNSEDPASPRTNSKELLEELFKKCLQNNLLVMPGDLFAIQATDGYKNEEANDHILDKPYFRMTFVGIDHTIELGLKIFGQALRIFFQDE